ncbi:MAG TPA: Xaa-Pro peptidase family protein [Phototrophicaceae bacterium]|nr:Xaa-Pro peptidase family protein [Phototrophicaceae bacterium]
MNKLRTLMKSHRIDVIALIPGANLRYLTGGVHFVLERPIVWFLPLEGQPVAIIPKLEIPLFSQHRISATLYSWTDKEGYRAAFEAGLAALDLSGKTIGVEGLRMRFFEGEILRSYAPEARIVQADDVLAALRLIKDDEELEAIRHAIRLSEQALTQTLTEVKVGMSEREIAALLEAHLRAFGADGLAFDTLLHAGANTALPHTGPLDYRLQAGDPILIDFGAIYQGYCADITRTVFWGEPSPAFRHFYEVVREANAAGRAAAKPGVTAGAVDQAAQAVLIEAGYQAFIRHRTGHGLGLEAHEHPYIVDGNEQVLEPGMVITIEPGLYEMGVLGVRIEDDLLITADGAECLTSFPRDLQVMGNPA